MSRSIAVLGLSITSSWGNGHATTWRALLKALAARGHRIVFLERDVPWYAENRDLSSADYCEIILYPDAASLRREHEAVLRDADLVIVGSYVPDGAEVIDWVQKTARRATAFYDIDTPVTVAALTRGACTYLGVEQVAGFDHYFSFTGGPLLDRLQRVFGARAVHALYCSVDPALYHPEAAAARWDLGYLGTYSADRQPMVEALLLQPAAEWPAGRFVLAGPQYPPDMRRPANLLWIPHLAPAEHRRFYNQQRFTLNVTRADMVRAGWSPSVRLFEAAACGVPIISDAWPGLEQFFRPEAEIVLARSTGDVLGAILDMTGCERRAIGDAARRRVLASHTADHRAAELEAIVFGSNGLRRSETMIGAAAS